MFGLQDLLGVIALAIARAHMLNWSTRAHICAERNSPNPLWIGASYLNQILMIGPEIMTNLKLAPTVPKINLTKGSYRFYVRIDLWSPAKVLNILFRKSLKNAYSSEVRALRQAGVIDSAGTSGE